MIPTRPIAITRARINRARATNDDPRLTAALEALTIAMNNLRAIEADNRNNENPWDGFPW